jgi:choline dehydrogenase-like flavoprotein
VLTRRQREVLAAVCDTLVPEFAVDRDAHGFYATGAQSTRTVERVEQLIGALQDPSDRLRLGLLLSALDSRLVNLLLSHRWGRLPRLSRHEREAVLRSWAHSRIPLRRAGFQALKRLTHVSYLCWPTEDGGHPAWQAVGHPGPLPHPQESTDALPTLTTAGDTTLECDVVVVGSGAGGGVAAGVLAASGLDVVVLEKGPNPGSRDMTQVEGDMLSSLYLDGGLMMTRSGSMPILAGSCLGGGTTINYTTSMPLPESARAEWDRISGLSLFSSSRFQESVDRVESKLRVNTRWSTPGMRDALLERGCKQLGWHVDVIPRNVTDCLEGLECGYCGYGCRHGAKNTTTRAYLAEAQAQGARIVVRCDVERVLTEGGRAVGVSGLVRQNGSGASRMTVRARAVVVAAGAIYTPAILRRSGVESRQLGRGLRLHPATALLGRFPERVDPWSGALMSRYSSQFADIEGGYGARFETAPAHFALVGSAFGWESARQFRDDLATLGHVSLVGVLLRDRDAGRVDVGRDGRPRVHYELSDYDVHHARAALRGAAQVLEAAGALDVFSLQTPPARAGTSAQGWLEQFVDRMDGIGYRRCRMSYISFHQMGTAAMGADPKHSVIGEMGEAHAVPGLYVADGSAFPTSSGVNPMITIMALADHVGRGIVEGW